jgi:hypothetical protein
LHNGFRSVTDFRGLASVLRRAENVRIGYDRGLLSRRGCVTVYVGNTSYDLPYKMTQEEWQAAHDHQRREPPRVGSVDGKSLWHFCDKFYWETEGPNASEVCALLFTRNARQRRKIERAQAIAATGMLPQQHTRTGIPDDLKLLVWQRDGGQCLSCGRRVELQYDHIIPVAMGGATSEQTCKLVRPLQPTQGAGLTAR